jgi:hypothetical protein
MLWEIIRESMVMITLEVMEAVPGAAAKGSKLPSRVD